MTKEILTKADGKRVGEVVAKWAKEHCVGVEDAEVLSYEEDGEIQVGLRIYGDIASNNQYKVMEEMRRLGLKQVETVIGLSDDGFVTMYGHGPNVSQATKLARAKEIVAGIPLPNKCKVTIKDYCASNNAMAMMWISSTMKPRANAAVDVYTAEKTIRKALKGVAKFREAERIGGSQWTVAYWFYV